MRNNFVESVLTNLVSKGLLSKTDRIVTVCSGQPESELFRNIDFTNITITNLDPRQTADDYRPYQWSSQNAMNLTFPDQEFDFAFVSDGLHHCSSPHRALLEMYRVAKRGIIVIESRDSLLMRLAVRLGASPEYEVGSVEFHKGKYGGVDNTDIPNYIYRWTEREFEKTVCSFDPTGKHQFIFVHGFNPPGVYSNNPLARALKKTLIALLAFAIPLLAKRQGNGFAMIALRPRVPDDLWSWLRIDSGNVRFRNAQDRKDPDHA